MRVISGQAKGHRLKVPKGRAVRPTAGRVKEALFNILPHDLSGLRVLDLFAGTGNLSAEALSRGAAAAILVDFSPKAGRTIRENLRMLGFSDRSELWTVSVLQSVRLLSRRGETFDLIFFDPPYRLEDRNRDRKSTRLNSSHLVISYAVFCLKKKKNKNMKPIR